MEDEFGGELAPKGKKFAVVTPVKVGISGENHYSVQSGVAENKIIVTGGYRVLSKELYHGILITINNDSQDKDDKKN